MTKHKIWKFLSHAILAGACVIGTILVVAFLFFQFPEVVVGYLLSFGQLVEALGLQYLSFIA